MFVNQNVDVIIPTYKRSVYLKRAIESVLCQSYKNVKIIVVDDNNEGDEFREETKKTMQLYKGNSRVVYLKHKTNKNGAAARNTGIRFSDAKFVAFLDDDDFFLPKKIERQMDALENLDSKWGGSFCFHARRYKNYAYTIYSAEIKKTGNYCYEFLSGITSFPSSTILIKREVFDDIGFFDETFKRHQDWEFLVRFFRNYKMVISPFYDTYMQIEGFRNYPNSKQAYNIKVKFLDKYKQDILCFNENEQKAVNKFQWFEVACLFLKDQDFKNAKRIFKNYVFVNKNIKINDLARVAFFLFSGYFPILKKGMAVLLGSTRYSNFSGRK